MSYTPHPEAEEELMGAATYLAEYASPKVAHAYIDEFERVAELVELYPGLGTPQGDGLRAYPFSSSNIR